MAKKTFKADLSVNSIKGLIKELESYKVDFMQEKLQEMTRAIAERGVEIAKANINTLDAIFTGELFNSIHIKEEDASAGKAVFCIVTDSEHAAFVEFGTGQLGQEGPYPYPLPDGVEWNYNTGQTIFEISPGEYGWFYYRDGQWYFTQGMPSRPFMYETSLELIREIPKIAKTVFGK